MKPKATTCRHAATCETQRGWLWIAIAFICGTVISANADAQQTNTQSKQESSYSFNLGFPADDETIKQTQDATDLRRAIEAYKYFFPTVATEAVIQQFEPHGAVPNKVGVIMPQDPGQQFSVANQDTPYIISVFDLKDGPIVIEVPEGPFLGLMDDHHMEWFGDMGDIGPRFAAMQAIAAPQEKELVYYPPAAIRVHESVSPPIKNRSHELIAEVDMPAGGDDGMLVTAGGRTAGYGLFVKNGRLTYVYNYIGINRTMITSSEKVPAGKSTLSMKFTKTGKFEGDAEIFIDGKSVGKAHLDKTVPITFSIEETFDVGEDTGSPVIEDVYAVPFRCESLQKLTVKRSDD